MDKTILDFQKYLKTKKPLGITYNGPADGLPNQEIQQAAVKLIDTLKSSPNKDVSSQASKLQIIIDEANPVIDIPTIDKLVSLYSIKEDSKIKAIQEILSNNNIVQYTGPKDGIISNDLVSKLVELENKINSISGANVSGKIVANNTIIADPTDLKKTLDLLASFQKTPPQTKNQ